MEIIQLCVCVSTRNDFNAVANINLWKKVAKTESEFEIMEILRTISPIFHFLMIVQYIFAMCYDIFVNKWKRFDGFYIKIPFGIPLYGRIVYLAYWGTVSENLVCDIVCL